MKSPDARRYGIISDVHANLPALDAALAWLDRAGVDQILNLGDMVGYGQQAAEVLDRLMARSDLVSILGNHDRMLLGGEDLTMRDLARDSIAQARGRITERHLAFLRDLPEERALPEAGIMLVHSSLTERDAYILSSMEVKRNLECMQTQHTGLRLCLFGHTHIPMLITPTRIVTDLKTTQTLTLKAGEIHLINVGSVGQPRDRCQLLACGLLDLAAQTLTVARLQTTG